MLKLFYSFPASFIYRSFLIIYYWPQSALFIIYFSYLCHQNQRKTLNKKVAKKTAKSIYPTSIKLLKKMTFVANFRNSGLSSPSFSKRRRITSPTPLSNIKSPLKPELQFKKWTKKHISIEFLR